MNKQRIAAFLLVIFCSCFAFLPVSADFTFSDIRFQNDFSTENLDAIIEEYELYDGWYWTTPPDIQQDFHGHPESPGCTSTVLELNKKGYLQGWYGCRWPIDHIRRYSPYEGGYAECFAFAQFIGYLLSGEINPQHNWDFYYSLTASSGLRVGDIVRVEYRKNKHAYRHSAVVYAINGEEILFLQVSGGNYNKISIGKGFSDGNVSDVTSIEELSEIPGIKISRYNPYSE